MESPRERSGTPKEIFGKPKDNLWKTSSRGCRLFHMFMAWFCGFRAYGQLGVIEHFIFNFSLHPRDFPKPQEGGAPTFAQRAFLEKVASVFLAGLGQFFLGLYDNL